MHQHVQHPGHDPLPLDPPLSAAQLQQEIERFLKDKYRGISIKHFCEICGLGEQTVRSVFLRKTERMSRETQMRVNRAYAHWKAGRIRVMKRPNGTMYVEYRKQAQPVLMPQMGLKVTSGGIKLNIGVRNRHDYSAQTLDQQLRGQT